MATLEAWTGGPAEIDRYDRLRNINFEIELNGQPLGEVERLALALPSLTNLPPGILQTTVGDAEVPWVIYSQSFAASPWLTGVLCIYIVLVLLFKDFVQPVTILAALVLSIPGAFPGLVRHADGAVHAFDDRPDHADGHCHQELHPAGGLRDPGASRPWTSLRLRAPCIDACRKRARPIVMTTIAMGAGMLPIALGLGRGPELPLAPMAIVVIGGLITSTFLSLLVIPVVFTYVDDAVTWLKRHLPKAHA